MSALLQLGMDTVAWLATIEKVLADTVFLMLRALLADERK